MMPIAVVIRWRSGQRIPLVVPFILLWPLVYPALFGLKVATLLIRSDASKVMVAFAALWALQGVRGFRLKIQDRTSYLKIDCY